MFWTLLGVLIGFVLASPGCSSSSREATSRLSENQSSASKTMNADESRIYSTVLDAFRNAYGAQRLLILDETTVGIVSPRSGPEEVNQFLRRRLPDGITQDILDDFKKKNEQPIRLRDEFATTVNHSIIEKGDERLRGDWDEFSKNNLGAAIVQLSRIAFNRDASQALVYISSDIGSRSGWGYYVFLTKSGQDWQIKEKQLAWVS